jgi:hypothetical protein
LGALRRNFVEVAHKTGGNMQQKFSKIMRINAVVLWVRGNEGKRAPSMRFF